MVVETSLYELLGVGCNASHDDIRKSYRQAAMRWHPDRNPDDPNAAENFKACLEAYEVLSDPEKRAAYDSLGMSGIRQSAAASSSSSPASSSSYQPRQQQQQQQRSYSASFGSSEGAAPFPNINIFGSSWDPFGQSGFQSFRESASAHAQTRAQTRAPAQAAEPDDQPPRGFPSWTYQMSMSSSSSTAANGTYSTEYHTWNNVDGHRSGRRSGTIGDGGFESADSFAPGFNTGFSTGNLFSSFGLGSDNLFMGTNMNGGREAYRQRLQSYPRGQWWA